MMPGKVKSLIVGAVSAVIAAPFWLLGEGDKAAPPPPSSSAPVRPALAPPLEAALERRLFAEPDGSRAVAAEEEPDPGNAPQLVGIIGRLPDRAVALVRTLEGGTRSIAIGESFAGWRLQSMSADAAFFTRGDERIRVALPPAETAAQ